MGLFAKATAKKADTAPKTKRKETVWLTGSPSNARVNESVHELLELDKQIDTLSSKMNVHKNVVKEFAEENFISDYAALGVPPETPLVVQNSEGEKVTYVVQDRSGQYQVKADQQEALTTLLGADALKDLLYEETSFGFNRDILAVPGVQEVVEKALEKAMAKLTDDNNGKPLLTPEQAEMLLDVKQKTSFKPGTMDRLVQFCGRDTNKISQFLEIVGSHSTRYVKT